MGDYVTEENTKVKLEDDVLTPEFQKEERIANLEVTCIPVPEA